jgi:hypothetical protein
MDTWVFSMYVTHHQLEVSCHGPKVELGKWTHVVGTYDGTVMCLYVNGALVGTVDVEVIVFIELHDETRLYCTQSESELKITEDVQAHHEQEEALNNAEVSALENVANRVRIGADAMLSTPAAELEVC